MYISCFFLLNFLPLVPCTSYLLPRPSYLVPCSSYLVPRTLFLVPRTSHLAPRTSYLVPCTLYLAPRTLSLVPCTSYLVDGFNLFHASSHLVYHQRSDGAYHSDWTPRRLLSPRVGLSMTVIRTPSVCTPWAVSPAIQRGRHTPTPIKRTLIVSRVCKYGYLN